MKKYKYNFPEELLRKQYSDEELQKYIATLPKTFEDWITKK